MVGEVLGHYQIDAKIGEGGYAAVYKGRDIRLDRVVAVKVRKEKYLREGTVWGRLLREARIASTLNPPNFCTLYDIGEERDINYVVLGFVPGKTLRTTVESGPLPINNVFQYGMQIADAMAYTHGAGVLHEDFKSSNIMVTPIGRIKVVDFGLARFIQEEKAEQGQGFYSSKQEIGYLAGTLPYMAPEVLRGATATTQSGVWSLGLFCLRSLRRSYPLPEIPRSIWA